MEDWLPGAMTSATVAVLLEHQKLSAVLEGHGLEGAPFEDRDAAVDWLDGGWIASGDCDGL